MPIILNCGPNISVSSCSNSMDVSIAFVNFINDVTLSGGCNASLINNAPLLPPDHCEGGEISVVYSVTSSFSCDITTSCVRTFTVLAAPAITFVCGEDMTTASCQTQATIDAAKRPYARTMDAAKHRWRRGMG
ncbi:MAG: hypothetical protein IPQ04_14530 [Saprospiraceae bacterium]|nr:hypothetical protein [Saprospiraceae bacterium]